MKYDADIFDAVEFGDLETVRSYWTKEIDINYQDLNGMTLLMFASYHGFEDIVDFLLELKPKIELVNNKGKSAMDLARENGYDKVLDKLINKNNQK